MKDIKNKIKKNIINGENIPTIAYISKKVVIRKKTLKDQNSKKKTATIKMTHKSRLSPVYTWEKLEKEMNII